MGGGRGIARLVNFSPAGAAVPSMRRRRREPAPASPPARRPLKRVPTAPSPHGPGLPGIRVPGFGTWPQRVLKFPPFSHQINHLRGLLMNIKPLYDRVVIKRMEEEK